jgi:hypothetical protein
LLLFGVDPDTAGTAFQSLMLDQIPESSASSAAWPAAVLLGPTDPNNPKHLESMQRQDWIGLDLESCLVERTPHPDTSGSPLRSAVLNILMPSVLLN